MNSTDYEAVLYKFFEPSLTSFVSDSHIHIIVFSRAFIYFVLHVGDRFLVDKKKVFNFCIPAGETKY
jgi:hypothetical protein